mgnify:CR=1 FL=1
MKVIIGCEESQRVCIAFRERGHEAYSCDIKPCSGGHPAWHIQDDILKHLNDGWDFGIFHPDCTYLANSGVCWRVERKEWRQIEEAAIFFNTVNAAPFPHVTENPIQHKYARTLIKKYNQIVHPHYFGDPESKATCLWLTGVPELVRTHFMDKNEIKQSLHYLAPSNERKTLRSKTFQGIANAMASQWG